MPLCAALAFTFLSLLLEEVTDSDRHDFLGIVHSDFYYDITRTYVCGKNRYIYIYVYPQNINSGEMVYYLHDAENMENMGDLVFGNWAQLCLQISLMMRLQKLYFLCFHILNLLASWNWFWMPFICHWAEVKSKTMIYHILLTHLFIAQLLLLSKRHSVCFPKETESTFHFLFNWWKFNWMQVLQFSTSISRWQLQRGRGDRDWDSV